MNKMSNNILHICFLLLLIVFVLSACGGGSSGSISIQSPDDNALVSGEITIRGRCSLIDNVTVVIDNDAFSRQVVECSGGNWSAEFDTTRFQDGYHGVLAFASEEVRDQIQITTANGNLDGFKISVPVDLIDGIYDEIDDFTPLFVYAKKISTGLITGKRFTVGTFPGTYEIPNVLNGLYEIGAILDRNNNITLDEGWDFEGKAESFLEVSNEDITSGQVILDLYDGEDDNGGNGAGGENPVDVSGDVVINQPDEGVTISGMLSVQGHASGSIEWVTVIVDNNRFSSKTVEVSRGDWQTEFDTSTLQDGAHTVRAYVNDDIWDLVEFTTNNGNVQGYQVDVTVNLDAGLHDEIGPGKPLIVYVQDPVTGRRIIGKFTSGDFSTNNLYSITNVPNNTYVVGAFMDRNNNGVEDSGDFAGQSGALLDVWYADASAELTLVGNEIHITKPEPLADIRANYIDMAGTYTFQPEEITVLMRITPVTFETVEAVASFSGGNWNSRLDITDVTQEGERWLSVKAKYGATYKWDSIIVDIDRKFPRGIDITVPAKSATITSDALAVSGTYIGTPEGVNVELQKGDGTSLKEVANFQNGNWSVTFADITTVQDGSRSITATANYTGAFVEQDVISVFIQRSGAKSVTITSPMDGDTITTDSLVVQGNYEGVPDKISVSLQSDDIGGTLVLDAQFIAGNWNITFPNISTVTNGSRTLTATADYGGGVTEIDTITLTIDRPLPNIKEFNFEIVVTSLGGEPAAIGISYTYDIHDCPRNLDDVTLPWSFPKTMVFPFESDCTLTPIPDPLNEVLIAASAAVPGVEGVRIEIYVNDILYHSADVANNAIVGITASWDGNPASDVVFSQTFP